MPGEEAGARTAGTALRLLVAIALVVALLVAPWPSGGSVSYTAEAGPLDSVSPANTTAITFSPAGTSIGLASPARGTARVDLVHTDDSYVLTGDLEVADQAGPLASSWHAVGSTAALPSGAATFQVHIGAANATFADFASVEVVNALEPAQVVFASNFSSSRAGWALAGPASFGTFGSPPLPGLQVTSVGARVGEASTTGLVRIPANVTSVRIESLMRFNGTPGAFKIALDVQNASRDHLAYLGDWGAWSGYGVSPTPLALTYWTSGLPGAINLDFTPATAAGGSLDVELTYGGALRETVALGAYRTGTVVPFALDVAIASSVALTVGLPNGTAARWSSSAYETVQGIRALVQYPITTFSASVVGMEGFASDASVANASFTFSGSDGVTGLAGSPWPAYAGAAVALAFLGLLLPEWGPAARSAARRTARWARAGPGAWAARFVRAHGLALAAAAGALALYGGLALTFGGHPYDAWVFKVWSYTVQRDGMVGLYVRPSFVGDAVMRGGDVPWGTVGFVYGPLCAPLFVAIAGLLPPLGGYSSVVGLNGALGVGAEITWLLALFTVAAGLVLYFAVRRATGRTSLGLVALLLVVLNPAVVFDSAVWGETDSVLYLLIVLFAALAVSRPALALAVAAAAMAFKETGAVLLLPAAMLVLWPGLSNVERLRRLAGGAAGFLFATLPVLLGGLLPNALLAGYSGVFAHTIVGTPGVQPAVTPETYTVWTLITGWPTTSGAARLVMPSYTSIAGPLTFAVAASATIILAWLAALVWTRWRRPQGSLLFWLVVTGFAGITFTALLTGTGSRYYTLALPGLAGAIALLVDRGTPRLRRLAATAYLVPTAISLWTMLGLFAVIEQQNGLDIRGLGLAYNPASRFALSYYTNGPVVTLGSLAAIGLVVAVALLLTDLAPARRAPARKAAPGSEGD
jgi:hypothetical protein